MDVERKFYEYREGYYMSNSKHTSNKFDTRQIAVNMLFSVIAFGLNLFINFYITPYITNKFGSEAYGFVKLASDFTNYASLFSIALNSMASRFLMLKRACGDINEAQKYYSSIWLANIVLSAILVIPSFICVLLLDFFMPIPTTLILEVKLTFSITFASFIGNLAFSTYSNCFYLTNKLSIGSIRDALMNVIRVASIILLFSIATPRISYVALGGLIATIFSIIYDIVYTRKLTPEFKFRYSDFQWKKLWQVVSTGIWNSITKLSQIFSSGLDLMVTNLFIGSKEMGYLAVAKTVPNVITSFNSTVANVFSPNMMELYAIGDMKALKNAAKSAMKFMCLFVMIPNAILITMGEEFFTLWVPNQPAKLISILSVLTVINSCVTGPLTPLYQIFTITNKVKQSSIVLIVYGFSSILVTFMCLKFTDLGLFAVAGVSLIGSLIVALFYHLPFAAIYIGLPWYSFFLEIAISIITLCIQCIVGWLVNYFLVLDKSWLIWFTGAIVSSIIGVLISIMIILNKQEKKIIFDKVKSLIRKV